MSSTLKPIIHREAYTRAVAREINAYFAEAFFAPLLIVLRDAGVPVDPRFQAIKFDEFGRVNAISSGLEEALRSGKIQYSDGVFSGRFSSATTKELRAMGARYDSTSKTFRIAESSIPNDVRGILADSAAKSAATNKAIDEVLRQMEINLASAVPIGIELGKTLTLIENDLAKQFISTTASMTPEGVALKPTIDTATRKAIEEGFTNNLDLSIKNFAQERIPELRRRVEENVLEHGGRTDRLAKILEAEFGVTKRKAEFLADQETGLLVSKYRETKYTQLGIRDYLWSTSNDSRVRPSHRVLNGKKFSFAVGANVAEPGKPARYCNPGQDYRCRCVPRPLINLSQIVDENAA